MRLTLPLPVSLNRIWRHGSYGQVYLTREGKTYKKAVHDAVTGIMRRKGIDQTKRLVSVRLWVFWPDLSRRRDQGNVEKLISDALNGTLWEDDNQIFPQFLPPQRADEQNPRVEVLAEEWDGTDTAPDYEGYSTRELGLLAHSYLVDAESRRLAGIEKRRMTRLAKQAAKADAAKTGETQ